MRVDIFDFDLPEDRIALRPAEPRDSARMLHINPSAATDPLADRRVRDLPDVLRPGDIIVVNDTRVIPARLEGRRMRGDSVRRFEATLHKRESPDRWRAFVKPAKRIEAGDSVRFGASADGAVCELDGLDARIVEKGEGGEVVFEFAMSGPVLDEMIERIGTMPLPPYIAGKRATDDTDASDYQTMFAEHAGAVAAPTAGLHFTPELLERIAARGIDIRRVTLHVGAGTFLPVKAEDTDDHRMHSEYGIVTPDVAAALNAARALGGRIVPIGTTSLRILESAASEDGTINAFAGDTSIFITPGYRFRATDLLLTNFHLPRSTLFMLVCAYSGIDIMKQAYAHAIETGYRFYSYGDACLLEPQAAAVRGALS